MIQLLEQARIPSDLNSISIPKGFLSTCFQIHVNRKEAAGAPCNNFLILCSYCGTCVFNTLRNLKVHKKTYTPFLIRDYISLPTSAGIPPQVHFLPLLLPSVVKVLPFPFLFSLHLPLFFLFFWIFPSLFSLNSHFLPQGPWPRYREEGCV
jgi:hypothetical protein